MVHHNILLMKTDGEIFRCQYQKKVGFGNSPAVQWLGLRTFTAKGPAVQPPPPKKSWDSPKQLVYLKLMGIVKFLTVYIVNILTVSLPLFALAVGKLRVKFRAHLQQLYRTTWCIFLRISWYLCHLAPAVMSILFDAPVFIPAHMISKSQPWKFYFPGAWFVQEWSRDLFPANKK